MSCHLPLKAETTAFYSFVPIKISGNNARFRTIEALQELVISKSDNVICQASLYNTLTKGLQTTSYLQFKCLAGPTGF